MSAHQTFNPIQTLANDSRAQLEPWLEEFETHARNLCAQHDATGALKLTLVASDLVWQSIPANQTTAVRIAAGDSPFRARPTWDQPAPHPNNAAAAVVSLHKMETARYADFSMASSQQCPQHCPIGQCWGEKPEPPEDDLPRPRPEALHALSARHSRHHARQARNRY